MMPKWPLRILLLTLCAASLAATPARAQDAEGCKDHPLFNRMPMYDIGRCEVREFDSHEFLDAKGNKVPVEGKLYEIQYSHRNGAAEVTRLQIQRNYQSAIEKIGGKVVGKDDDGSIYLMAAKDGKEYWVHVNAYITDSWTIDIVEKQAMRQDIVADAKVFASDIQTTGHAAIYGIYFDTGKAIVKPTSQAAIAEIGKLLKTYPAMKLDVVGHTDNVGLMDANMALSKARADAVVQALVTTQGIAPARLKGYGVSSLCPVASNDAEAGRAKNRRVELVKQ
jgi:outer membrane protein OmpA-like peptidoglycan-associated protein